MQVAQGLQLMQVQDGGIEEAVRRAGVHQGLNWDGRPARDEQVNQQGQVAGKGGGEGGGGGKRTTQPGSYWLGRSFFGTDGGGVGSWGGGMTAHGPG